MKSLRKAAVCIMICTTVFVFSSTALAGGFALYEGSARGNALGCSVIARADDPSALFFNPAGITQLPGTQTLAGATLILPMIHVRSESGARTDSSKFKWNYYLPPVAYITHQQNDRLWLGLGFFCRFGLGSQFDDDWPGRFNFHNALVHCFELNPNAAWKLTDRLSVSAGVSAMRMDLRIESKAPGVGYDTSLTGDGYGFGYNFGIHYKATDRVRLGLSYRSKVHIDLDGRADFIKPAAMKGLVPDGHISSKVTLPDELMAGVAYQLLDDVSIELSAILTRWSTFDQMSVVFQRPVLGIGRMTKAKDWHNAWRWQAGIEYTATRWLDLRVGYVYDQSPVPGGTADYMVPTYNVNFYCAGFGLHWRNWDANFSYSCLVSQARHLRARPADGILESRIHQGVTHLYGVDIGYKF